MNKNNRLELKSKLLLSKPFIFIALFFFNHFSYGQVQTQKAVTAKIDPYVSGYYESLPVDYSTNTTKKYPILIFLHGKGEIGNGSTGLPLVLRNGPPKLLNEGKFPSSFTVGGKNYSFIVISPQINVYNYSISNTVVSDVIAYCKQKYRVDEQRIYITGLSMGGSFAWTFVGGNKANADIIAASLLVCSGASASAGAVKNIATSKLPVWITNNSGDPIMSATAATAAAAAINAYVPAPPKAVLSIFNASGHDAWTKTYDPAFKQNGLNVYEWMLSYSRGTVSTPPPVTTPALPVANAGANQVITLPVNSLTLDGSKSAAPGGTITKYAWTKVSGGAATITSPSAVKTTITGLVAGTYQFKLVITDSNGNTSSSTVTITVNATTSVVLKSNAGANQTITLPVNTVTIDGGRSTFPSGTKYYWRNPAYGTITNPALLKTTVTGLNLPGDYMFQLVLTDPQGNISTSTMHVIVKEAVVTVPLKANAGANQTITLPVSSVTIDGGRSTFPAGTKYYWLNPAYGTIANTALLKTTVTGLTVPGDYTFHLVLIDSKGNMSTSTMHVIVNKATAAARTSAAANTVETVSAAGISSSNIQQPILEEPDVTIYPNPIVSDFTAKINSTATGKVNILIYNLQGQVLIQQEFTKDIPGDITRTFSASKLSSGIYLMQIVIDNKYKKTTRIIKQ